MPRLILALCLCASCFYGQKEAGEGESCGSDLLSNDVTCSSGAVCYRAAHANLGVCRRACSGGPDCQQGEVCIDGVCREACAPGMSVCGKPSWCTDDGVACIFPEHCCAVQSTVACATFDECDAAGGVPVSR